MSSKKSSKEKYDDSDSKKSSKEKSDKKNSDKKNIDEESKKVDMMIEEKLNIIYPEVRSATNPDYIDIPEPESVEVEAYIEVAGYTVPQKNHNSTIWIIIIIIVIIISLVILIWSFVYSYNVTQINDTSDDTSNYDRNYGALIDKKQLALIGIKNNRDLKSNPNFLPLNNDKCEYGMYGKLCNRQAHDSLYYNVGLFNSEYKKREVEGKVSLSLDYDRTDGTIDKNSCTSICNVNDDCRGVEYDHDEKRCYLIVSDLKAKGPFKFDLDPNTQIYMKNQYRPSFIDRVIGFKGSRLPRYYIGIDRDDILNIPIGEIVKVLWIPTRISNHGSHIGFWSNHEFNIEDIVFGRFDHVDTASGEYNIPDKLKVFKSLFVLYIARSEYKKLLSHMNI